MRGNAKNLKPLLTPTVERMLRAVEPADAGLLVLWYCDQYRDFLDVLESVYERAKSPRAISEALDGAPEPPHPQVSGSAQMYFPILRGEAQDMVESNITGKLADRERKRKKVAQQRKESAISGNSAENAENPDSGISVNSAENPENAESGISVNSAENPENAESGISVNSAENPENAESPENPDSFLSPDPYLSETSSSVSQTTRARTRTHEPVALRHCGPFGADDYRRAGEAAGFLPSELPRFLALNERGALPPAEAVRRFQAHRTPTEQAGGAAAVAAARANAEFRESLRRKAEEDRREEARKAEAAAALLALADERGVATEDGIRAIGLEVDAFVGDVAAAVEAWRDRSCQQAAGEGIPPPV